MGLSASQARFLQLTARKSNIEYEAQRINFERLQLADKLDAASSIYQDKTTNRKLVFTYNNGEGPSEVDVTYKNYKNYMNKQMEGFSSSQTELFLVSSSGNKIIVANEEEMEQMITRFTTSTLTDEAYKEKLENGEDVSNYVSVTKIDDDGKPYTQWEQRTFNENDFLIAEDLNDVDNFQSAIQNGTYYFAKKIDNDSPKEGERSFRFQTDSWDAIGGGAISDEYDKSDDAAAEAEFGKIEAKIQKLDQKLELRLDQLESERKAIETELDSVSKVIEDNIEASFKTFS